MTETPIHNFTFILGPEDLLTEETADHLYELFDDSLVGARDHRAFIEFDREGSSFADTVIGTLKELEEKTPLRVLRVEPDELVSLSVIAGRVERSVESVRLLAEGKRGPGHFPTPVAHIDARTRLWEWSAVAKWWQAYAGDAGPIAHSAEFLASLNDVLDLRARSPHLAPEEKQALSSIADDAALAI